MTKNDGDVGDNPDGINDYDNYSIIDNHRS